MADYAGLRAMVVAELARHRAIIHVDLDCFYCQVEQQRLALGPDVPLAVQQWQDLIAVNYPARRRGVRRMDTVREARAKCPELVLVHVPTFSGSSPAAYHQNPSASTHKASLDEYRRVSRTVMGLFKQMCPTMGKASIDEAYLDVSEQMRSKVLADLDRGALELVDGRASAAAAMAGDPAFGAPIYDEGVAEEVELPLPAVYWVAATRKGKEAEPATTGTGMVTEYGVLVGDAPQISYGWGDLVLRHAAVFAQHVRRALFQQLGYRASAGIAHNRFLAKIGSGLHKPNQQTVFPQSQVAGFMYSFPIASIPSLGGKLGALVAAAFGAQTAGDLAGYTAEHMALKIGVENALHVHNRCRGIDDSPVVDSKEPASFTSTKHFPQPVAGMAQLDRWILINSADLWARVSEEWAERRRWPRSLTVSYTASGQTHRSKTVPFPPRDAKGGGGSSDTVAAATRACLADIASGPQKQQLFPLSLIALSAKSFQREQAGAALMERWLSRSRTGAPSTAPSRARSSDGSSNDDGSDNKDGVHSADFSGESGAEGSDSDDDDDDDDYDIPGLQQPRPATTVEIASQPTLQVPSDQLSAAVQVTSGAYEPLLSFQPTAAQLPAAERMLPGAEHHGPYFQLGIPDYIPEPDLVAGSDVESYDSDQSCIRTPPESESGGSGDEEADASDENGSDAADDEMGESSGLPPGHAGRAGTGGRRHPEVYIQPNTDQESAARYGEGYKNMSVDQHDDGSLELAASARAQGGSVGSGVSDGFIPALIAAARRKREIRIVSFQPSMDHPEGAIDMSKHALDDDDDDKGGRRRGRKPGESSRTAGGLGAGRSGEADEGGGDNDDDDDDDSAGDGGIDEVLDVAVRAMMESISASQAVMEIHCPQCPDAAPTVSSREWDTHRDWHMARRLQERELRRESAWRIRGDRPPAKRPRPAGGGSPKRRQQTITEAWR